LVKGPSRDFVVYWPSQAPKALFWNFDTIGVYVREVRVALSVFNTCRAVSKFSYPIRFSQFGSVLHSFGFLGFISHLLSFRLTQYFSTR